MITTSAGKVTMEWILNNRFFIMCFCSNCGPCLLFCLLIGFSFSALPRPNHDWPGMKGVQGEEGEFPRLLEPNSAVSGRPFKTFRVERGLGASIWAFRGQIGARRFAPRSIYGEFGALVAPSEDQFAE